MQKQNQGRQRTEILEVGDRAMARDCSPGVLKCFDGKVHDTQIEEAGVIVKLTMVGSGVATWIIYSCKSQIAESGTNMRFNR